MKLVISTVLVLILPTMALVIAESVPAYSSDSPIGGAGVLVFSCCPSVDLRICTPACILQPSCHRFDFELIVLLSTYHHQEAVTELYTNIMFVLVKICELLYAKQSSESLTVSD